MPVIFRVVMLCMLLLGSCAQAASDIIVDNPYFAAGFAMSSTAAGYMTLSNHSDKPVTLVRITVNNHVASKATLHTSVMENGMAKMRALADGVTLAAGEQVRFSPGGKHIMLHGLQKALTVGTVVPVTFYFSDINTQQINFTVKQLDNGAGRHHHH
ncbi:copper chaperone PCu(A)C [Salinimonas sediminis]|uniref:Copper chaperone PCu(A)C n=1 Tax=Salinimonas sediminis TaxID=2303538 RepID=A0A346NIA0_9ALTE|nr:copper chaperone PCu(A)C [Salinimonas sediminis]AXR05257.1 copper chaperone PCu(A)C [Salinimonas sediminis]